MGTWLMTHVQQISNDHHPIAREIDQGCRCLTTRWTNNSTPNIPSRECLCCSVITAMSEVFSDSVQSCLINCENENIYIYEENITYRNIYIYIYRNIYIYIQCICFLRKWEHFPLAHVGRHREALDSAWLELQQRWLRIGCDCGILCHKRFCVLIQSKKVRQQVKCPTDSYWYSLERDEQSLQYSQCQWEQLFWRKPVHWESESGHQRGCKTTIFKRTRISCPWSQWSVILPKNRQTSRKIRNFTMSISSVKHKGQRWGRWPAPPPTANFNINIH